MTIQAHNLEERVIELAADLFRAREAERTATASLRQAVREAHADGMSLYRLGQLTGLTRKTIREWTREPMQGSAPKV